MLLKKLNPAVSKYWLIAMAGLIWSAVGIMLLHLAYIWLATVNWSLGLPLGSLGIISALAAYRYGFSKIALKNIVRHYFALLTNPKALPRLHLYNHRWRIVPFKLSLLPAYLAGKNSKTAMFAA